MKPREFITLLAGMAVRGAGAAAGNAGRWVPRCRIRVRDQHFFDESRQGMREHGYTDGKTIALVDQWAEARSERFVGELLSLRGNVIWQLV